MRLVSLVPAGTDILFALGLGPDLVGVSHECQPRDAVSRPRLTRSLVDTSRLSSAEIDAAVSSHAASGSPLYEIDARGLADLRPDLIITQGLCDVCALPARAVSAALTIVPSQPAVVSLDSSSIDGMLASIVDIGDRVGRAPAARTVVDGLQRRLDAIASAVQGRPPVTTVCLEWLAPPYCSGHWIPEMVTRAGGRDVLGRPGIPSVATTWRAVADARAEVVIAMPCGYTLERAIRDVDQIAEREEWKQAIDGARVFVGAGGQYFTRPGPELVTGIEVLASILHPDAAIGSVPAGVIAPWR